MEYLDGVTYEGMRYDPDYEEKEVRCNYCSLAISKIDEALYGRCCVLHADEPVPVTGVYRLKYGLLDSVIHNALLKMRQKVEWLGQDVDNELRANINLALSLCGCYHITDADTVVKKIRLINAIRKASNV